jgi:hypothetical protein
MPFDADLLTFVTAAEEAQKALDSVFSHDFDAAAKFSEMAASSEAIERWSRQQDALIGSMSVAEKFAEQMASSSEAIERWSRQRDALIGSMSVAEKFAEQMASSSEAIERWSRQQDALIGSVSVPLFEPRINIDWSVISPRRRSRMPPPDPEPSNERTIVRPEVKRKIGFNR